MLNFPEALSDMLSGYAVTQNQTGRSSAEVYHCVKDSDSLYLKIQRANDGLRREFEIMSWLNGRLPVPKIRYFAEYGGRAYLLMETAVGHMTCDCTADELRQPYANTIGILARGLAMIQVVDINDCPFDNRLDKKLRSALRNIENGVVDMDDFEAGNDFDTPLELYNYLVENRPAEELCFTHGDYCLPNVFIDGADVTGFIDLGRAGIADKWQDIALCVRSIGYNLRDCEGKEEYIDMLLRYLGTEPDWDKINYYILLDELF